MQIILKEHHKNSDFDCKKIKCKILEGLNIPQTHQTIIIIIIIEKSLISVTLSVSETHYIDYLQTDVCNMLFLFIMIVHLQIMKISHLHIRTKKLKYFKNRNVVIHLSKITSNYYKSMIGKSISCLKP